MKSEIFKCNVPYRLPIITFRYKIMKSPIFKCNVPYRLPIHTKV